MTDRRIDEDDLHRYVDGRLDGDERQRLEAVLATDRDSAARVDAYRANDDLLRAAFAAAVSPSLPPGLKAALEQGEGRRFLGVPLASRVTLRGIGRLAAVLVVLAAGGAAGWQARDWYLARPAVVAAETWAASARDALAAHRLYAADVAHPVEFETATVADLSRFAAKRLAQPSLTVPDLSAKGYRLRGARVLPAGGDVAVLVVYEAEAGDRLTLYIRNGQHGESALRWLPAEPVRSAYWVDDGCVYVVSASLDRDALNRLAVETHDQLEGRPPGA
jgi:anti-sigma factor RsiW